MGAATAPGRATLTRWLLLGAGLLLQLPAAAAQADFGPERVSPPARHVADWAVRSADHGGLPFVVVDKVQAMVYVFDAAGRLQGAAAALLGSARGDASSPGIGQRKISSIRADERTTPAGRFAASIGRTLKGEEILWVDYETAVALHPVVDTGPREARQQRLASGRPAQRRITYGCINVDPQFFQQVVASAFRPHGGTVYVLPETRPVHLVFGTPPLPAAGTAGR